jgi:flagellar M-ring protein FliF
VLKLRGELESGQIRAVRHLVASAVEGLKPERVSIIDEQGRLLADGAQSDAAVTGLAAEEKQAAVERRLRSQVEQIVARIVGEGRARVQVAAELDLNRIETRAETFDPESRVVRSTQTRAENQVTTNADGQVSVGNELPGASAQSSGANGRDASNKNEEVINYEISRTTRTEVVDGGRLKRLSVAVLVDGTYGRTPAGEAAYQARPQEELDRIAALVRTAIGFDKSRGDQVEVVNLRFADAPQAVEVKEEGLLSSLMRPSKEDILRLVELGILSLLTLVVLLTVVRPMLRTALGRDGAAGKAVDALVAAGSGVAAAALAPPSAALLRDSAAARMIELAKVTGEVQAESLARIGEMVKDNPSETVSVLRQWIHERG